VIEFWRSLMKTQPKEQPRGVDIVLNLYFYIFELKSQVGKIIWIVDIYIGMGSITYKVSMLKT
jgi:hypothetical protein